MATSGTYAFNPALGESIMYAFGRVQVRPTAIMQEHMWSARMAANMVLADWSNRGVNLWAVDLQTVTLVQGQATYNVPLNTVTMLDAYVTIDNGQSPAIDRIILPVSRTEYASYPNKTQQGFTTVFWFDRLISPNPTVTLWPVPDGTSAQTMSYYRVRQLQDAETADATQAEIPYLWQKAFIDALSAELAVTWKPDMASGLQMLADKSYDIASRQNVEQSDFYISPGISSYFRP